jgi:hypothetical protein
MNSHSNCPHQGRPLAAGVAGKLAAGSVKLQRLQTCKIQKLLSEAKGSNFSKLFGPVSCSPGGIYFQNSIASSVLKYKIF